MCCSIGASPNDDLTDESGIISADLNGDGIGDLIVAGPDGDGPVE